LDTQLGQEATQWLLKYFPSTNHQDIPPCLWSESTKKLFFPIDEYTYQYRYFGQNPAHPKWVGYGITDKLFVIYGDRKTKSLVIVEDLISAWKVGHTNTIQVMPIFGSNISLLRLAKLKLLGYTKIIIWLDWDKRDYVIKPAQLARKIGLDVKVIRTPKDPKDYSYEEIRELLVPSKETVAI
jgi:hypothetical protein